MPYFVQTPAGLAGPYPTRQAAADAAHDFPIVRRHRPARRERVDPAINRALMAAETPDAECFHCGDRFWSGTGHPTLALCRSCVSEHTEGGA